MKTHTEIMAALVDALAEDTRLQSIADERDDDYDSDAPSLGLIANCAAARETLLKLLPNARATVALAAKGMELLKAHYEAVKAEWVKDVTTTRDAIYAEHAWPKDGLVETGLADIHALLAEWGKKDG